MARPPASETIVRVYACPRGTRPQPRSLARRVGGPLDNSLAVVRMHLGVAVAVENDGRNGRSAIADLKPAPAAWRRTPKGSSLAATQARPEWIPTAAYRSHAPLPGWRQPPRPPTSLRRRRASDRSDSLVGVALPSALCTSTAVAASSEAARHSERVQARASVPLAQSLCLYSAALT
jgi:hypothetical protein